MRFPALLALVLAACGGDPDSPTIDAAPPPDARRGTAELGTGAEGFEPLADDQPLAIIAGPQGGFHFIVNARLMDLAPGRPDSPGSVENPTTTFAAFDENGRQIDRRLPPYHLGYEAEGDWLVLPSGRILQIENDEVPALADRPVRITVDVVDKNGVVASDERWIVALPPE